MFRHAFILIILLHGFIHLTGFAKAFGLFSFHGTDYGINKGMGILWLITAAVFIAAAITAFSNYGGWWMLALPAVLLSQVLIITAWPDAKSGTIVNVLILLATVAGYGSWSFKSRYILEVSSAQRIAGIAKPETLTEGDLNHLPEAVKKYIRYTGSVGKPKVHSFKIVIQGQLRRDPKSEWMNFRSQQVNFIDYPARLFYLNADMMHMPVSGLHAFRNGRAFMDIRLFSLFKVQYQAGPEMDTAETVTYFNDMCCMAPATLIDPHIQWEEESPYKAKAVYTNNGITISAWLYFNEKGELINFISDDRYATGDDGVMKKTRWSTPLKEYRDFNGHKLPAYAEAIYCYPDRNFCYGTFRLKSVAYNSDKNF